MSLGHISEFPLLKSVPHFELSTTMADMIHTLSVGEIAAHDGIIESCQNEVYRSAWLDIETEPNWSSCRIAVKVQYTGSSSSMQP
jgi:hypothetical protein